MDDLKLKNKLIEKWNRVEPKLKIGREIDMELYDELLWFDFYMSILLENHISEVNGRDVD